MCPSLVASEGLELPMRPSCQVRSMCAFCSPANASRCVPEIRSASTRGVGLTLHLSAPPNVTLQMDSREDVIEMTGKPRALPLAYV